MLNKILNLFHKIQYEIKILLLFRNLFRLNQNNKGFILADRCDSLSYWHLTTAIGAALIAKAFEAKILFLRENKPLREPPDWFVFRFGLTSSTLKMNKITKRKNDLICQATEAIFSNLKHPSDILKIKYRGLLIGPEIYDEVLNHRVASVKVVGQGVKDAIKKAVSTVESINTICERYPIVAACCTHTKCAFDGIWIRVLLAKKIPVYQALGGLGSVLKLGCENKNGTFKIQHHCRPPKALVEQAQKKLLNEAKNFLKNRYQGDSFDWDAKAAFNKNKKFYTSKKEFCKNYRIPSEKKIVFVMLHAFSDGPHTKGLTMFIDFYHWFLFTLSRAAQIKNVHWVFKSHPRRSNYPDDCDIEHEISLFNYPNVSFLSSDKINAACIKNIADGIVTAAGTAGVEYPCFGIPSLICCENGYHGFGICSESATRKEYEKKLQKIAKKSKATSKNRKLQNKALIIFYLMHDLIKKEFTNGIFNLKGNDEAINMKPIEAIEILLEIQKNKEQQNALKQKIKNLCEKIKLTARSQKSILILNWQDNYKMYPHN